MNKKIIKKVLPFLIICIIVFESCHILWEGIFTGLIPWTRTWFSGYKAYTEFLDENHCISYFVEELPAGSGKIEYYWHQDHIEKFTAYSAILTEEEYKKIAESRIEFYQGEVDEEHEAIVFILQEDGKCYTNDFEWYNKNLKFIEEVMQNPEAIHQYYFLIISSFDNADSICYDGVILNDTTCELIEFSAEIEDDTIPYNKHFFWRYEDFYKEMGKDIFCEELPVSAQDTKYHLYKGEKEEKYGYHVRLSEEDYNRVKQERKDYYYASIFVAPEEQEQFGTEGTTKYADLEYMQDHRIDFLDKIVPVESVGQYFVFCNIVEEDRDIYKCRGVLCNDETFEIIEYSYSGRGE